MPACDLWVGLFEILGVYRSLLLQRLLLGVFTFFVKYYALDLDGLHLVN